MDHLICQDDYPFIYPRHVSVQRFIDSWKDTLAEDLPLLDSSNRDLRHALDLNIPAKMVKSLEKDLNPDHFCKLVDEEKMLTDEMSNSCASLELETLKEMKVHNERQVSDSTYRMHFTPKYRHDLLDKPTEVSSEPTDGGHMSTEPLAVLTVQIFKPAIKSTTSRTKLQLDRQFEVLSNQSLSALRDNFICVSDVLSDQDFSDNPLQPLPKFREHDRLGFFFIEKVFYSDTRCASAYYVERMARWAEERKLGQFSHKSMSDTMLHQLTIQLGFPYLYMHGNNCEHLLVFTDIRLFLGQLQDSIERYPKCTAQESMQKLKCQMCGMYFAKWVVIDNARLPSSPFYFCHTCFMSFNYDQQHKKKGTFQAYPILFNLDR